MNKYRIFMASGLLAAAAVAIAAGNPSGIGHSFGPNISGTATVEPNIVNTC